MHKIGHDWGAGLLEQDNIGLVLRGYFQTYYKRIAIAIRFFLPVIWGWTQRNLVLWENIPIKLEIHTVNPYTDL